MNENRSRSAPPATRWRRRSFRRSISDRCLRRIVKRGRGTNAAPMNPMCARPVAHTDLVPKRRLRAKTESQPSKNPSGPTGVPGCWGTESSRPRATGARLYSGLVARRVKPHRPWERSSPINSTGITTARVATGRISCRTGRRDSTPSAAGSFLARNPTESARWNCGPASRPRPAEFPRAAGTMSLGTEQQVRRQPLLCPYARPRGCTAKADRHQAASTGTGSS